MEVSHVEMGVERDEPNSLQRQSQPEHARAGHCIVAADEQGQRMERRAELDCVADRPRGLLDRQSGDFHVPAIRDPRRNLAARLNVVAAYPPKGLAKELGRLVASAGRDGSGGQRRSDQSDRGARLESDDEVREVGPAAHPLTLTAALA